MYDYTIGYIARAQAGRLCMYGNVILVSVCICT